MIEGKNYLADNLDYRVIFNTRKNRNVLDEEVINAIKDGTRMYLDKNNIRLIKINLINEHLIYLELSIPPEIAVANAIYNIKRFSFSKISKNTKWLKIAMQGEHALWTRKYAVTTDNKTDLKELFERIDEND